MNHLQIGLLAGVIIVLVWVVVLSVSFYKERRFMRSITDGVTKKDLRALLKSLADSLKTVSGELNHVNREIAAIQKADQKHLQKIGLVRYNPFTDTGGDQSFCLCFLDQNNDGIIVTSLHSREQTRIYAKGVSQGKTEGYALAKEEEQALLLAMKQMKKNV